MPARLFVLAFVNENAAPPKIVRFGPTSESPALLASFDAPWPAHATTRVIVPTDGSGLLRVRTSDLRRALAPEGR